MNWEEDREIITQAYFERINANNIELFGRIKENLEQVERVFPIIGFIISRIDTVLHLALHGKLWDAEIIERSVLEATLKLLFIISRDEKDREVALKEYWNDFAEINEMKFSDHAKKHLVHFEDEATFLAQSALVFSEEEEQKLKSKWTKAERHKLEQKWSFSEIVTHLNNYYKGPQSSILTHITHPYRISSHVAHGDETGISIIYERENRQQEEKDKASRAHFVKLFDSGFHFSLMISLGVVTMLKDNPTFFLKLEESLKPIREMTMKYTHAVFEDPDYNKFRNPKK